jgi:hypothetical protein
MLSSSLLSAWPLFHPLSKLTVMTLVSEVLQTRKFSKGEVIMLQSRFSPTHTHYRKYYTARLSKFAE